MDLGEENGEMDRIMWIIGRAEGFEVGYYGEFMSSFI